MSPGALAQADQGDHQLHFQQLLQYCRVVLGNGKPVSQRDLAVALDCAPTMAGRYLAGDTDFFNLRGGTIELIAAAAQLDVSSVFIWVRHGREAAMRHEQMVRQEPVGFSALDHLEAALLIMKAHRGRGDTPELEPKPPNYGALRADLQDRRGSEDSVMSNLFDSLVESIHATETMEAVRQGRPLTDEDWLKLQTLLGCPAAELKKRYGFGRMSARTSRPLV